MERVLKLYSEPDVHGGSRQVWPRLVERVAAALDRLDRTRVQPLFNAAGAHFWSRVGD